MPGRFHAALTAALVPLCLGGAAGLLLAGSPTAEEPAVTAGGLVREALRDEVAGGEERLMLLSRAIQVDPQHAPARWHAGQVSRGGQWVDYARVPALLATESAAQEYRSLRQQAEPTAAGHLRLADWCRDHDLKDRERAHLTAALALSKDPNNAALRQRLGHTWTGGAWASETDIRRHADRQHRLSENLQAWLPRLERLVVRLDSPRRDTADAARKELLSIADPAALPALEVTLSDRLDHARLLVEVLAAMKSHRAADFLARQAVLSPSNSIRQAAAEALRKRPPESYAPELLAAMQAPVESHSALFVTSRGVSLLQEFRGETQDRRKRALVRSTTSIVPVRNQLRPLPWRRSPRNPIDPGPVNLARELAASDARTQAAVARNAVETQNEAARQSNEAICEVLATATGVDGSTEPRQWWKWWLDYNQLEEQSKPEEYSEYWKDYEKYVRCAPIVIPTVTPTSCLVAGTPVWTGRGPVPVEQVQVGDLVLAKSPESGELAYKPVLRTTVRDATPVLRVTTDGAEFRATGGHTFWVSGRGWTKVRDARPGERFHGVSGPAEVRSVEPSGEAKTYNLVTADFHTYFVGEDMVLSHDVTFAEPVDAAVPGLAAP